MAESHAAVAPWQPTIYSRFQALYLRDSAGHLLHCTGPHSSSEHVLLITKEVAKKNLATEQTSACPDGEGRLVSDGLNRVCVEDLVVYELNLPSFGGDEDRTVTAGLILSILPPSEDTVITNSSSPPFEAFFARLLLRQTHLSLHRSLPQISSPSSRINETIYCSSKPTRQHVPDFEPCESPSLLCRPPTLLIHQDRLATSIADIFETQLLYRSPSDAWLTHGRPFFLSRTRAFISTRTPIEFVLPAFPCKSSNLDKVSGIAPDRGEELALERLHGFCERVREVWPPGATVWVVSDGHVFADCVGRGDGEVDGYGEELIQMNQRIWKRQRQQDGDLESPVRFKSLVDLFELDSAESLTAAASSDLHLPMIEHDIPTARTYKAELSRQIFMAACCPARSSLRSKITAADPDISILSLYRGFSRFMLEDLAQHASTQSLSKTKRKKLAAKVAFEMILRNQAYSNLVEMMMPDALRLSIHAHGNGGASGKFAVGLFEPGKVRMVGSLDGVGLGVGRMGESNSDHLHIPTPWHNCVVEVEGEGLFVTRSRVVREAVAKGLVEGAYVEGEDGRGAYFQVTRVVSKETRTDRLKLDEQHTFEEESRAERFSICGPDGLTSAQEAVMVEEKTLIEHDDDSVETLRVSMDQPRRKGVRGWIQGILCSLLPLCSTPRARHRRVLSKPSTPEIYHALDGRNAWQGHRE